MVHPELSDANTLTDAIREAGSVRKLARKLGVHHQTVLDACGRLGVDPVRVTHNRGQRSPGVRTPEEIRRMLAKGPQPLPILAKAMGLSEADAALELERMRADGYNIKQCGNGLYLDKTLVPSYQELVIAHYGNEHVFGVCADTHYSSKASKPEALHRFYRLVKARGGDVVFNGGDLFAGVNVYAGQMADVIDGEYGYDAQLKRGVEDYPHEEGVTTYCIGGNHDGSFLKAIGADIVSALAMRRPDIKYLGHLAGRVTLEGTQVSVDLLHPDGGMPYARSYRAQKVNEGYGRRPDVPQILILGHLHVANYLPYLGIHELQAGCFEGQTSFLRRKGIFPEIGGWICTVNLDKQGRINRFVPEWVSFDD